MNSDIIYFELNDWEPDEDYPNEEPFKTWMEDLPFPLIDNKWAKENKLCIVYELVDQSMNYCITANRDWVEKNCPQLLTRYKQFLREPENNETYGHWGTKFLEYKPENFGSNYAACLTIHEEKNEYEEQLDWDYRAHEYLDN